MSTSLVHAEQADRAKPLFIEADTMRHDDANKITTATGNVVGTKGTILMRSDTLEVRQDAEGNQFTVAVGRQAFMRQKREGLNEFIEGQANRIERDEKTQMVRLIGKAVMRRLAGDVLADEIRGETLEYNEATEVYNAVGAGPSAAPSPDGIPGGRVRAMIGPRQGGGAAVPRGPAASGTKRPAMSLQPSTQIGGKPQ
ncbi:MAG: lipopolysaccharide transport periplasmic protein LptA [Brachymonas sp.]|nr:lipopolysaccharide transport periplasmic protein LptA [Brachymonas sp.]